jgi:hypothetical protein
MGVNLLRGNYTATVLENGLYNILELLHPESNVYSNPFLDVVTHSV